MCVARDEMLLEREAQQSTYYTSTADGWHDRNWRLIPWILRWVLVGSLSYIDRIFPFESVFSVKKQGRRSQPMGSDTPGEWQKTGRLCLSSSPALRERGRIGIKDIGQTLSSF